MLIDAARAGSLPRLFAPMMMPLLIGLHAYMKTYSVRRGEHIRACIVAGGFQQIGDEIVNPVLSWNIIRVLDFQGPEPIGPLAWQGASGLMNPPSAPRPAWNAEEQGYGWPESFGSGKDEDGNVGLVRVPTEANLGLHAITFSSSGQSLDPLFFIVRPTYYEKEYRLKERPIMLCWPWSTTLAYTDRQDAFTNLYDSWEPTRLRHVSLDRPVNKSRPYEYEAPLNMWKHLVDTMKLDPDGIEHCTSFDLDAEDDILSYGTSLFISAGHDEYWSKEMRDNVELFVEKGGNAAFFSANTAWWRVRFEGPEKRTMTCYKSSTDDPVALIDPNEATGEWCSTNRPENLMTGVSYRRGTQQSNTGVATKYRIPEARKGDPLLDGVKATTFPEDINSSICEYESDGADYVFSTGMPVATGADGTPTNFTILATLDQLSTGIRQRGRATMGYFTRKNGGRVFTAGTTDWCYREVDGKAAPSLLLSDHTVQTITTNVVTAFTQPQGSTGQDWILPHRVYPKQDWTRVRSAPTGHAIVATVQGELLLHDLSTPYFQRADPENPQKLPTKDPDRTGWERTLILTRSNANGYGSDLFGKAVYAASDEGIDEMFPDRNETFKALDQQRAPTPDGKCKAVAAIYDLDARPWLFAVIQPKGDPDSFLYAFDDNGKPWRRLGRTNPAIMAMATTDGKLLGVGRDQRIYCRDVSRVDLVWSPICPPPIPGGTTRSIAAYYGRLFALAEPAVQDQDRGRRRSVDGAQGFPVPPADSPQDGVPVFQQNPNALISNNQAASYKTLLRGLYWRTVTSVYGGVHPHMLFLDPFNGFAIGTLEGSGYFTTTGGGALPINMTFTQAVRVAHDVVLFYHRLSRHSFLYRFFADGTAELIQEDDWGESWEHIVYVHAANSAEPERLFFYRPDSDGNSVGMVGHFIADENDEWHFVVDEHRSDYGRWDWLTATWSGRLVFYDAQLGAVGWGSLDDGGHFVDEGGAGLGPGFEQILPAGNEYVVFHRRADDKRAGSIVVWRISERGAELVGTKTDLKSSGVFGASSNGLLLFLQTSPYFLPPRSTGAATSFGIYDERTGDPLVPLNKYPESAFGTAWERMIALGVLS